MTMLATRLKSRRLELGLSQAELAEGICEQGQISRIEKG
ncbi:TPA: helix-turn-helix domain-containing protein, partial [Streptococcus suis]